MEYRAEPRVAPAGSSIQRVADLYEAKTAAILQRYGPGPRVHYHTGFVDDPMPSGSAAALRGRLVESQERMLDYATDAWRLRSITFADVLDVGCGLGGSAIYWAQQFGARVTAITIAPSHIELIARFARLAGVESCVLPLLCDAREVPGRHRFDVAIAIESSCLFPRRPWFRRLARVLRPAGCIFIFDCFVERPEYEMPFNRHWCAQIGNFDEYLIAARDAGFELNTIEDTSLRTARFWATSHALIHAEASESKVDPFKVVTLDGSLRTHALMQRGLLDGGLRQLMLSFSRSAA